MNEGKEVLEKENILESEKERFVRWLVVEKGICHRNALIHARCIVRMLRKLNTLIPTKQQCQQYRDNLLMGGKKSRYVLQIVKAIRHYGRFVGRDLVAVRYPRKDKQKQPIFLTQMELKQMLFACSSIKEKLVVMLSGARGFETE
jgi:hypothetical protein